MENKIEILPGIFYDPDKEWYEQAQELIDLALIVEKTQPIEIEVEKNSDSHQRYIKGVWEHSTVLGRFRMQVNFYYEYPIDYGEFLAKSSHNKVSIVKL